MQIKKFDKYILIGIVNRLVGYYTGRSLHGKAAVAAIGVVAIIFSSSLLEILITAIVKPNFLTHPTSTTCETISPEIVKFVISFLLLCLATYWIRMANKERIKRVEAGKLVFEKNTGQIAEIGASRVHAFCGSITQISGIEVVVTSENTDLNLGSMTGTSVSGRIRALAATKSTTGEIITDNIGNFIQNWKTSQGKIGNFPLGHCIVCTHPYEAASKGIKTIIFAVAIKKNSDGTSTIDEAAINGIVGVAIDTAISNNQRTLFIPVFGLGSGNTHQRSAIKITTNAVKAKLGSTNNCVDVYIGVYRIDDLTELCMSINQS